MTSGTNNGGGSDINIVIQIRLQSDYMNTITRKRIMDITLGCLYALQKDLCPFVTTFDIFHNCTSMQYNPRDFLYLHIFILTNLFLNENI